MKNEIRILRAKGDLTQEDLSSALGVTRQTIIAIEKGRYDPSLTLAFRIARHFGLSVEDIFHYDEG